MGAEDEGTGTQGGQGTEAADLALAKELGFDSVDELRAQGKGLKKWQTRINNERQAALAASRQAQPVQQPDEKDDVDLENVSPKVIKAIRKIVRDEVGPDIAKMQHTTEAEMASVVADFLEANPELTREDLFDTMSEEELWPSENEVTKPLLKRRLNQAKKLLAEPPDDKTLREQIRAEELKKLKDSGAKVVDIKPAGDGGGTPPPKEPSNWVERMNAALEPSSSS